MNIDPNEVKVKIKMISSGSILAQATIILFDVWEEKGWKVLKSNREHPTFQDYVWIQAPSFNTAGQWKEIVFVNDKRLYEEVQQKIFDAYVMEKNQEEGKASIEKDINNELTKKDYEAIEKMD